MSSRIGTGELDQLRNRVKQQWNRLTNQDLEKIEDMRDELVERVQDRYGYAKQRAEEEVDRFFTTSNDRLQEAAQNLSAKKEEVKQKLDHNLGRYNEQIEEAAGKLPGDIDRTMAQYPWVTMAAALGLGLILGLLFKPCLGSNDQEG